MKHEEKEYSALSEILTGMVAGLIAGIVTALAIYWGATL